MSSGHLGGVLSLWDQYESHMDEINGTRSGWGSGDSSNSSTVRSTFTCVTALLSALPRGQAWPTFQDLIYPSWPASPLKAQEGDDSMTAPPPPCFYHAQPICQDPGWLTPAHAPGSCLAGEAWLPVAGGLHDSGQMQVCLAKSGSPQRHSIS